MKPICFPLFLASYLIVSISFALNAQGAATSPGFKCDVTKGGCSCDVNIEGDCDLMKKNCKDGKLGTCAEVNGKQICVCDMRKVREQAKEGTTNSKDKLLSPSP